MKYVNFLFHIYQPPLQDERVLAEIVKQSYEPLTRQIRAFHDLRVTLNINFSLVELLSESYPHVIENIQSACEAGALEFTGTGAYHPIFPLIPIKEVERQIELNNKGNHNLLSIPFKPEGIFPPELAFTGHLVRLFKSLGYKWALVDDASLQYYGTPVPYNEIYTFDGFGILLRSNTWANKFARYDGEWKNAEHFVADLLESINSWMGEGGDGYLIIALDGETFGHHRPRLNEAFLADLFTALQKSSNLLTTAHLADIYQRFPKSERYIPPCSWSTDRADIERRDYFAWWKSSSNAIHQLQWKFMSFVLEKVRRISDKPLNDQMDKAIYSCQFWWASYWKFDSRDVSDIYRGAFNLMRILQMAADLLGGDYEQLREAEMTFRQLVTAVEAKRDHFSE